MFLTFITPPCLLGNIYLDFIALICVSMHGLHLDLVFFLLFFSLSWFDYLVYIFSHTPLILSIGDFVYVGNKYWDISPNSNPSFSFLYVFGIIRFKWVLYKIRMSVLMGLCNLCFVTKLLKNGIVKTICFHFFCWQFCSFSFWLRTFLDNNLPSIENLMLLFI